MKGFIIVINKKISNNQITMPYIIGVLLSTWTFAFWIFSNPAVGLSMFALVMFVPAVVAIIFNLLQRKSVKSMFICIITKPNLKSMIFGIGYPLLFITICAVIALLTGFGYFNPKRLGSSFIAVLITSIILIFINLIPAFGEEYGWRGYLLSD